MKNTKKAHLRPLKAGLFYLLILFILNHIFIFEGYSADTILSSWKESEAYRPYPIIFCHGFSGGNPHKWAQMTGYGPDEIDGYLLEQKFTDRFKSLYDDYYQTNAVLKDLFTDPDMEYFLDPEQWSLNWNSRQILFSLPYLERMAFNDPYGSIDKYPCLESGWNSDPHGDTRGWAEKLNDSVESVFNTYNPVDAEILEKEKIILICHSMGGLAAREFLTNTKYPNAKNWVSTIITINTPHKGSNGAFVADYKNGLLLKKGLFSPLSGIFGSIVHVGSKATGRGDKTPTGTPSVVDMSPDSQFLSDLNNIAKPDSVKAYCLYSRIKTLINLLFLDNDGTDIIVPVSSQRADGTAWIFDDYHRQKDEDNINHGVAPKTDEAFETILQWLDAEPLAIEITEPVVDANGEFEPVGNTVTVRGKVLNEFFPADCEMTVEYREAGIEEWTEITFQSDPENKKRLKPTSLWDQWRKGFIQEKVVAEFEEVITLPNADRSYQLRATVKNPAGIMAQSTFSEKLNCILLVDSNNNEVYCIDMDSSFDYGSANVLHRFKLRDENNNLILSTPVGIASNAVFDLYSEKFVWIAFSNGTIRKYNIYGEPVKIDNSDQWTISTGKSLVGLRFVGDQFLNGGYLACIASDDKIYKFTRQGVLNDEYRVPDPAFTYDVYSNYDLIDAAIFTSPGFGYGFIMSGSGLRIDEYIDENLDGIGYLSSKINLDARARAFFVMNNNNSPFYWRFIVAGEDNSIREIGFADIGYNRKVGVLKTYNHTEINYDDESFTKVFWNDFINMTYDSVPILDPIDYSNSINDFNVLNYRTTGSLLSQGGSVTYVREVPDGDDPDDEPDLRDMYTCAYYVSRDFFDMYQDALSEDNIDKANCNLYFHLNKYSENEVCSFSIYKWNFDSLDQISSQPDNYFNDISLGQLFTISDEELRVRMYEDKTHLVKLINIGSDLSDADGKFVVKIENDAENFLRSLSPNQDNLFSIDFTKAYEISLRATIQMKGNTFSTPAQSIEGMCGGSLLKIRVNPPTAECNDEEQLTFSANGAEPLTWESTDEAVGTIDAQGVFTAVDPGTCQIRVTDSLGNSDISGTITVY